MFPGQEYSEKNRIECIAVIFCVSIFTKSIYEWVMFFLHITGDHHDDVMKMLLGMEIFMPILWDVIPICTIFYLH